MPAFVAIAALLVVATLALVLAPLWRTQRGLAVSLAVLVAGAAIGLYALLGTPAALDPALREAPQTVDDAIERLQAELQRNPMQADGWRLLGHALADQGKLDASRDAFARAATLRPDDPDVLAEAAEARAKAAPQHRFDPQAVAMLEHALQRDPKHQRSRWFLGIAKRQSGDAAGAATTWEPLLAEVDANTAAALRPQLDAARKDAGLPPLPTPAPTAGALAVAVKLDPDFASRVRLRGDAQVFVIAREPGGAPMPVAVEKHALSELPFTATLDDGDSPMPTRKLSQLHEVELIARLSASGNAMPQEGDVESAPVRVALPAKAPVELVIGK
ncbi:tetratricopeptide repeat protein [Pseudoluteimonas lycopersici]|uniref:Tetratricopeptide repeat protein n=1 Tax=Pseudoluteimonas lycopersici TaxID=1324796 RepID=A0A516V2L0_9GAMM|nr:tetratricopeptide repeat protein [Lysobacter lycopersici]QDQ72761.1 tetratricopeptide repeat protein [Lysobacter lycopersici]